MKMKPSSIYDPFNHKNVPKRTYTVALHQLSFHKRTLADGVRLEWEGTGELVNIRQVFTFLQAKNVIDSFFSTIIQWKLM